MLPEGKCLPDNWILDVSLISFLGKEGIEVRLCDSFCQNQKRMAKVYQISPTAGVYLAFIHSGCRYCVENPGIFHCLVSKFKTFVVFTHTTDITHLFRRKQ